MNWYLTYFYRSGGTRELQGGSNNLRNLRFPDFIAQLVPIPPVNEQRRIVEQIEALFAEIDKGVESLKAAKSALDLYRKSVLKSAFEGRLTAEWRERNPDKLESPDVLLGRIRDERERHYQAALDEWERTVAEWENEGKQGRKPTKPKRPVNAVPKANITTDATGETHRSWVWLSLSDIGQITGGLTKNQTRNSMPLRAKYLRVANVYSNRLNLDEVMEIGVTNDELRKTRLAKGDLLFVEGNGSIDQIGRVAIWDDRIPDMTHQNHLIRFRANVLMLPRFALYFMLSPIGRERITAQASTTSGLYTLSISKVAALPIPFCSSAEQAEIVRILDTRLETAKLLEADIDAALMRAEALRQSILKKAFAGRLVPQYPTDEPASALLARIKEEIAAQSPRTSRKPRKRKVATA